MHSFRRCSILTLFMNSRFMYTKWWQWFERHVSRQDYSLWHYKAVCVYFVLSFQWALHWISNIRNEKCWIEAPKRDKKIIFENGKENENKSHSLSFRLQISRLDLKMDAEWYKPIKTDVNVSFSRKNICWMQTWEL